MADVSKIKLPNGTTYDIKDNVSGYTTNTGTITKVQTTAGAHTTINVSSGAAAFNVPTKTSHLTNDSGYITNAGVTGVKGNSESSYRTGQVNLTAANIGAVATSGNETVAGNKTFSGTTTLNVASTYPTQSGTIIPANSTAIIQSPIPKYLWHDIWAFCRATTPKYYTSTDGTTWVEATLEKNLFAHKEAWGTSNVLSSSIKGSRWTWLNGGFYASTATWVVLGITYKNPSAHFDLLLETSSDSGSTWTTMMSVTDLYYSQTPIWIRNTATCQDSLRLTLTLNANSASNAALGLCSIRFLTSRWGDQGKGSEFEHPYTWDSSYNISPLSGAKFVGDVTGNVSGTAANVTGTVAIANGGTGQTTAANAINALLNGLPVWTADPTDTTYFVRQDTGGSATYGKAAFSTIWNYISGKLPAWSKASTKPSYNFSEIGSTPTTLSGYGITDAKIASGVITLGSNTITPLTSSSTLSASKLSGAIPSAVTATTQASTDNSTKIATTAYVTTAIANLPEPMVFKGSVGTGGTVTSLPTAAASNEGHTYKVITALSSPAAKVGDTVISNGSSWVVIPSGDEPSGTVTSVGVSNATNGGLTVSGSPVTSSGTITIGHSNVLTSAQTTQAVYPIKIDKNGHISAYGNAITIPSDIVSGSGSTDYLARWSNTNTLSTTSIFINTSYNSSSDLYGTIKLYVGSTGQLDWKGQLVFYSGDSSKTITITPPSLTSSRTITLPDKTGTIALTSDIPTVSYPVTSVNNKTGAVSLTASDVGALASGTTYVSTVTTTAGTHTAISSKSGAVSFNVPTKTSHLTNDSGYLTGITSSQVTTALGYTPYNSTNPNGYTSNTGTVTKVTAGTGLSIGTTAGGNFTTSGTINHTNSVTAQTTQAVYPIKIDAQGHISAYGSAVTIPTVPSNIVNTITTTAGAHTAITSQKGNVSFSIPTTAAHVGAAASDHTHGNITNGGDITATAPTIANGDQIIINDNSASKITNGPTFDGSTTTTALTPKGTWETFLKSYTETDPTVPSWAKESTKPSYNFSEIGSTPTTIGDYGITDAKIASGTITLGSNTITPLTGSSTLFYFSTFEASNYDFTSQQYRKLSKSITARTGYSRIIISVRCTSHSGLQVFNWSLSENTITYEVINRTSSSISGANFVMNVLYIKSSLIGS